MTTQITVRLPDDLVVYIDDQVQSGTRTSRADAVAKALHRERRQHMAENDAAIYAADAGDDPDGWHDLAQHDARRPMDID